MQNYEQLKTLEVMKMLKPELDNWIKVGRRQKLLPEVFYLHHALRGKNPGSSRSLCS